MIKLVAMGLWICAITLASALAAVSWRAGALPIPAGNVLFGGPAIVKTRLITIPIIVEGAVQGYVVTQLAFALDPNALDRLSIKPDLVLVDEAIRTIYAGGDIDFRRMTRQDLPAMARAMAGNVNARFGTDLVEEVFIQELNYLTKDEVRNGGPN